MKQEELDFNPKKQGQRRSVQALAPEYRARFFVALSGLLQGSLFTVEDITDEIGLPETEHRNALGGLMAQAAAEGLIEKVGYTEARRKAAHSRVIRTWRKVPQIAPE